MRAKSAITPQKMEARKLKEGEAAMAAGAKCKKTSLLGRWKPDWEAAAAEYERAATCFKVGKAYARAIDAYVGASEAHTQVEGQNYMAAKHLESAGFLARDLKEAAKAAQLYEQAAKFHEADGRRDNAAEAYCKAARVLEGADDARAAALLEEACALPDDEDEVGKLAAFVEVFKTAVALLLRTGQPGAAAPLLRQQAALHARLQQPHAVARCELSAVVALLAADDFQSARDGAAAAQMRGDGFAGSDEADAADALVGAFAAQSDEALAACVGGQTFTFLENQVTRAAKALTLRSAAVPLGMLGGSAAVAPEVAAAAAAAGGEGTGDFGELAPEDELDPDDLT